MVLKKGFRFLTTTLLVLGCVHLLTAQSDKNWRHLMFESHPDFEAIVKSFESEWEGRPYQKGAGIKPFNRFREFQKNRLDAEGRVNLQQFIPIMDRVRVQNATAPIQRSATCPVDANGDWKLMGPIDRPANFGGIGRLNTIAFHPTDSNQIWAGAPSGGAWVSYDKGQSWATFTDEFTNLGISDIAFNPQNPNTIYMATGDRDNLATTAYGILKTENGGNTWSTISIPSITFNHRMLINPSDTAFLLFACEDGIIYTDDAGLNFYTTSVYGSGNFRHMEYKPGDPNTVYATTYDGSGADFHRSIDGGINWSPVTLPTVGITYERLAIGVSPADPDRVYLLAGYPSTDFNDFAYLFRSDDSGQTWSTVAQSTEPDLGSQFWYDWTLTVDPLNADILYAGGVDLARSTDGGENWSCPSGFGVGCANDIVHVDHHFSGWHPTTGDLWMGTDGGAYYSSDGLNYVDVSDGLEITQYYYMSNSDDYGSLTFGGSQDNGTHKRTGTNWNFVLGGDGMECHIDPTNPNNVYASIQNGIAVYKSTFSGDLGTFDVIGQQGVHYGESGAFIIPIEFDHLNPDVLYQARQSIWQYDGSGWTNHSGGSLDGFFSLTDLAMAKSSSDTLMTTTGTNLWRCTNASSMSPTWQSILPLEDEIFPGLPAYVNIQALEYDPNDATVVYATGQRTVPAGYDVFRSTTGGSTWVNISGSLPDVPYNCLAAQGDDDNGLYAGTDLGVYYRDDNIGNWILFSEGLPNVPIFDLEILPCQGIIRAATYGRGIWESPLYCPDFTNICCSTVKPSINLAGTRKCMIEATTLESSPAAIGYGYQWYRDGVAISGATSQTYVADQAGSYTVRFIHDTNSSCDSDFSEPFSFNCVEYHCAALPFQAYVPGTQYHVDVPGLADTVASGEMVEICLTIQGIEMNSGIERAKVIDENGTIRDTTEYNYSACQNPTPKACFTVTGAQYNTWIADNTLRVSFDPIGLLNSLCSFDRFACVEIVLPGKVTPGGGNPCPDSLYISGIIATDTFRAANIIISTAQIQNGSNVAFEAGLEIHLDTSFNAESGSVFNASISPCAQGLVQPFTGDRSPVKKRRQTMSQAVLYLPEITVDLPQD